MYHRENPPSMSIHEEATYSVNVSSMPIFSNLVMYDQHKAQNSVETIVPELATSWSWSADGKALTFKLREGVKWHDGKPFTSADVKCTFEMLSGKSQNRFRKNPRKDWFVNVTDVTPKGDFEVTFNLKRPQPALLAMLASGYTPIYACHVTAAAQRTNPIGTGPFKFVELKQNESIKLVKNPDYWKKGLPYLDGIEYTIIPNRSTAILGFVAGKFDMTFPTEVTIPLLKDVKAQAPNAVCVLEPTNVSTNLIINRESAPFDNADVRRAVALSLDRKSFIEIMAEGNADIGGAMLPPPAGVWGMPPEELKTVTGYGDDVKKNRDEARKLMEKAGFGPNKRLGLKISTRNLSDLSRSGRDPDRPAQGHLYRWRARRDRERHLVRQGRAQGISRSASTSPAPASTIRTRPSTRTSAAARSATTPTTATRTCRRSSTRSPGEGRRQAQEAGVGDRQEAAGGCGAPDPLSLAPGHLLGALREEHHHHVELVLQRPPLRGRVAG